MELQIFSLLIHLLQVNYEYFTINFVKENIFLSPTPTGYWTSSGFFFSHILSTTVVSVCTFEKPKNFDPSEETLSHRRQSGRAVKLKYVHCFLNI